jgi:hypothetical protein
VAACCSAPPRSQRRRPSRRSRSTTCGRSARARTPTAARAEA